MRSPCRAKTASCSPCRPPSLATSGCCACRCSRRLCAPSCAEAAGRERAAGERARGDPHHRARRYARRPGADPGRTPSQRELKSSDQPRTNSSPCSPRAANPLSPIVSALDILRGSNRPPSFASPRRDRSTGPPPDALVDDCSRLADQPRLIELRRDPIMLKSACCRRWTACAPVESERHTLSVSLPQEPVVVWPTRCA